jgi:3-deoxy-manno-octulosonate cytidylyltransferase (CMP-KDO synthetase)
MVPEECESGTKRISRALRSLPPADVVVNLQADEPEMPTDWIASCARALEEPTDAAVATIAVPIHNGDPSVEDLNVVKVVTDHRSYGLYFSRAPIPAVRPGGVAPTPRALRHVGLYAYRTSFLRAYDQLPASPLEEAECLEQLRFLQAGARIHVIIPESSDAEFRGVDTAGDYESFAARWRSRRQ